MEAQGGRECIAATHSRPGRALPPGKGPPVPIVQKAGWSPEAVWTQRKNPLCLCRGSNLEGSTHLKYFQMTDIK
jgi:hypothetical protein